MAQSIEELISYIPMDRRQALAHGAILGDRASGAVLFADISGFTPLTSVLYEELGPQRGAEELDRILNGVFDALIDRIHHYRGSVIGFSGDAITCWFDGDDGLWATACALQMQEVMAEKGSVTLSRGKSMCLTLKASAAMGSIRRLVVGDKAVQLIDVIAGELIDRVTEGEKAVAGGEVLVCSRIRKNLDGRVQITDNRTAEGGQICYVVGGLTSPVEGRPWLPVPEGALTSRQLKPWILPDVYERLSTGHGQFLAELRNSVALFLQFGGLDYGNDITAGEKLDGFIRWVQGILAHYGGSLINLTIGDKGSYLLASFGAPIAHEDDPRRAVAAALDLLKPPPELCCIKEIRIGISQGLMFSGAYGGTARRTYGVLGEETNVAARLMERAEAGQALVTGRISSAAGKSHRFEELEPVSVKGFSEPIAVCRLLEARQMRQQGARSSRKSAMVGRVEERRILSKQLQALREGQGSGAIIIEGEAGIGKSRLLEEFFQQPAIAEVAWYLGAGDAIEKNAPFHAWRPIFWQLFGLDEPADAASPGAGQISKGQRDLVVEYLQTAVPGEARLAPLLNAVLPLDLPDNDLTAQMSGEVRAGNTNDLLVSLLSVQAKSTPLLIVLEDAHWLDSASWALTRLVSRDIAPLLLVIATRPMHDPLPKEYTALRERATTTHVGLKTLPPQEALQLARLSLGVDRLPDAVNDLLLEKASGHPFFSEELAYALRDSGLLVVENGHSYLTASAEAMKTLSFPESIDSVITSRIDLLTAQQQLTLKVASVIGRIFAYRTLLDVHPVEADKPHLHDHLNALERLDITPVETPEPDLSYIFKHIITQEVTYNLMSFAQRQTLHQAIAEWLEQTYSADLSPHYALLAYHWQKALGDQYDRTDFGAKTLEFLEKAAQQSLDSYANREAADYYSELLLLNERLGSPAGALRRARWQRGLGEANLRLGNWKESRINMEAAVALLDHGVPANAYSMAAKTLAQIVKQSAYRLRSSKPRSARPVNGQEHTVILEASHAYRALGLIYWFGEELSMFLYSSLYHVNLSERLGLSAELVEAFSNLCVTLGSIPIQPLAKAYGRWSIEMAREIEDHYARAWTWHSVGMYLIHIGEWAMAESLLQEGCDLCAQIGYRRLWDESYALQALVFHHSGRFKDAADIWADVYRSAQRRDDPQPMIWGLVGKTEGGLLLNEDAGEFMNHLKEAESLLAAENLSSAEFIRTHGMLARAYLRLGNFDLAGQEAEKTLEFISATKFFLPYAFEGYVAPAEVYLTLWEIAGDQVSIDNDSAANLAWQGLKTARKMGRTFPVFEPRAWLYQGRFDWLSGRPEKAQMAWQKSIDLAQELGMPHEEGLAHYEAGRHLPPGDIDGDRHLQRAIKLFSDLEAAYHLNLAREALTVPA